MKRRIIFSTLAALLIGGCGLVTSTNKSVFVLVDVSGTYANNLDDAILSTRLLTSKLQTNDWIGFAQISSCSFSDDGLIVRERLPSVPSQSASAKTRVFSRLNEYRDGVSATNYTDIKGALIYAANELNNSGEGAKFIVVYSDMVEDVSPDCQTQNLKIDLSGITVVASNVTKLKSDESDPQAYFERLKVWENFVENSGGDWVLTSSTDQISELIEN